MFESRTAEYLDALVNSRRFKDQVAGRLRQSGVRSSLQPPPDWICEPVKRMLARIGIENLYAHQILALESIHQGNHTVVSTPTASGKSLIYNLVTFEAIARNAEARALYVYPLKALAQDQLSVFRHHARAALPLEAEADVYDGDTSAYKRRKIRQRPPHVLMTNPEMIHMALLPHHYQWTSYFSRLSLVVIDEVHTYRGIAGSHMALILRRLKRICSLYGAEPVFVFTSATMANPAEMTERLLGEKVREIVHTGPPQGSRQIVLLNPDHSPAHAAIQLLKAALARNLRTIVYTQSRKMAELIALWVQSGIGGHADRVRVYRAGLLPQERRKVEQQLKCGELLGIVSTSALELGIDIGDLDLCILVGYPGSMMATWQRAGRVGRKGQDAGVILIAAQDALDQYYMQHPEAFWEGRPEHAVLNPDNPVVLDQHLVCAASESRLVSRESWLAGTAVQARLTELENKGMLLRSADGMEIHTSVKRPHLKVNLRGTGHNWSLVDAVSGKTVGEIDASRLYRETHPGALYLHQGQTYLVIEVDEKKNRVLLQPGSFPFYTRVRTANEVSIISIIEHKYFNNSVVYYGKIKVTDQVIGFDRLQTATGRFLERVSLDLPPATFETEGFWFAIPEGICRAASSQQLDIAGGLHAAEHAAISLMPLVVLADRNDLGGLSTTLHPQTGGAAIFVYDGLAGGAGLSRQGYDHIADLLRRTLACIRACACETGCPACIHSPKCGSGNRPMDKTCAKFVLQQLCKSSTVNTGSAAPVHPPEGPVLRTRPPKGLAVRHYCVFDLETQKSAQEVGGWHLAHDMRVSCGVVYDSRHDRFHTYREDQIDQLIGDLQSFDLVVGFNSLRFDYLVLSRYSSFDCRRLPTLDLLHEIHLRLGYRLSLDHLACHTLNEHKGGSGLDALRWWKEGRLDQLVAYCQRDVCLTRDLFLYARRHGYLLFQAQGGLKFRIPMPNCAA